MAFFHIIHKEKHTHARAGVIHTAHGDIETPVFMPVGTQATVKTLDSTDLKNLGAQIILGNTYHLHLRPCEDLIAKFGGLRLAKGGLRPAEGGLHKFMNWDKPILTDSGGFQVFSLSRSSRGGTTRDLSKEQNNGKSKNSVANLISGRKDSSPPRRRVGMNVKIDEDGVTFRSHWDGSLHRFTPEKSIKIQHKLGADIIMAFDECTPDQASLSYARQAMERTHRWVERSLKEHTHQNKIRKSGLSVYPDSYKQYLFGIIQGANFKHLREQSAEFISSLDFDGIAIGGESIGYNMKATKNILDWVYPYLPENKPHYAMGLGLNPTDLFEVVERGIDMFDCVAPTRQARHGLLYVHDKKNKYRMDITKAKYANDKKPIDPLCHCQICSNYSRGYLHHLFSAQELTGLRLATIHNVHFFLNLMREMREAIKEDKFLQMKKKWC